MWQAASVILGWDNRLEALLVWLVASIKDFTVIIHLSQMLAEFYLHTRYHMILLRQVPLHGLLPYDKIHFYYHWILKVTCQRWTTNNFQMRASDIMAEGHRAVMFFFVHSGLVGFSLWKQKRSFIWWLPMFVPTCISSILMLKAALASYACEITTI